jgi:hypothetical protein
MGLTRKQRAFVENYLISWNMTRAASEAGYKWPNKKGWAVMQMPEVKAAVEARLKEMDMSAELVLARLGQQAEINLADFLVFTDTPNGLKMDGINWEVVRERGYLLKKLSYSPKGKPILELHDAQTALVHMGKHYRLFAEQVDMTQHIEQTDVKIYIPDNGRTQSAPEMVG